MQALLTIIFIQWVVIYVGWWAYTTRRASPVVPAPVAPPPEPTWVVTYMEGRRPKEFIIPGSASFTEPEALRYFVTHSGVRYSAVTNLERRDYGHTPVPAQSGDQGTHGSGPARRC